MSDQVIGGYRMLEELGSGGMGRVHLAESVDSAAAVPPGTRVALKMVHPHLLVDKGFALRFLREGEMGRRVRHENVVRTLDVVSTEHEGQPARFLVMEYVEGQTLFELLSEMGRLPEDLCRHLGAAIAEGLAAIHSEGIVHRDLKPENILVTADQDVKVMDLGVARLADELIRLSVTGAFVGSPRYASPEQFEGGDAPLDGRSDLYSLGLVLHELATGSHPLPADDFPTVMRRALQDEAPRAGASNPQVSVFLEEILLSLLEKDRDRRPENAAVLASILREGEASAWWQRRARSVQRDTHRPLRRVRIPRETAVYGRDADVAILQSALADARRGEGRVVLLEGEAGIGKTRLVDEFVERAQAAGAPFHFLFGSYPPGGAATSTGAFTTAYKEHFGEADLDRVVEERLASVPLLAPGFTALLKGEPPPMDALPLNKDSLQTAFIQATRNLADEQPVVLLVDDLHFAPEEGRELYAAIAHAISDQPVVLIGTARPGLPLDWKADLERLPQASAHSLSRLRVEDLGALLADNLGSPHLGSELSRLIERKSGGNPFFVFEIIRGLRDGQFLRATGDGTWETADLLEDIRLPESVTDLVRARLDDLSREDRDLLDVAACCGFEFDAGLLADALDEKRIPLLRRLAAIEKDHRLVRSSGRMFVFEHHQFREVLYEDMPGALREEYHGALAEALERRESAAEREPKDLPGSLVHALCEQFLKGGRSAAALRYLEPAMEHLEAVYLNEPAVDLAERALAVSGLVQGDRRVRVLIRQAARLDFLGRRPLQRRALDEAVAEADALGDAALGAMARSRLGGHLAVMARLDEAIAVLEEALPLARSAEDRETELIVLKNLGLALRNRQRPDESREHLETLLSLARESGDRRSESSALGALGVGLWLEGRLEEAEELILRHRDLAREVGDRRGEAFALGNLAGVRYRQGRYEEARTNYEGQLDIARAIGDRRAENIATSSLGVLESSMGLFASALERLERGVVLASESGVRRSLVYNLNSLAKLLLNMGALPAARRRLGELLRLAEETDSAPFVGRANTGLGQVEALAGNHEASVEAFDRARAIFEEIEDRSYLAETRVAAGAASLQVGDDASARDHLVAAMAVAAEANRLDLGAVAATALASIGAFDVKEAVALVDARRRLMDHEQRLCARWYLWKSTNERNHLQKAYGHLQHQLDHAPPTFRQSMIDRVPLHKSVKQAFEATRPA